MIKDVTVPARLCKCEVCLYEWITLLKPPRLPESCQNIGCRSRQWNGKKVRKIKEPRPKIVLPPPVRVRGIQEDE